MSIGRFYIVFAIAWLLSACAPSAPSVGPVATEVPSVSPTSEEPDLVATPSPSTASVDPVGEGASPDGMTLPAPLYFVAFADGQVWRLERDGQTLTQITFEASPIIAYDLAPNGSDLVYLFQGDGQQVVAIIEGGERREMLYGDLAHPLFGPDGQQIYVRINDPEPGLIIGQETAPAGIYTQFITGGRPSLVLADRPAADSTNIATVSPLTFTPAGNLLLLVTDMPSYNQAIGIFDPALGDMLRLPCCSFAFSADGTMLYTAGASAETPGTAQFVSVNAAGGAPMPLPPRFSTVGPFVITTEGSILAFTVPADEVQGQDPLMDLQRINVDGTVAPLRNSTYPLYNGVWSADGSGAVVALYQQGGAADPLTLEPLRWVPADPAAPEIELAGRGTQLQFGK
jgi:hypothetical protein